jgi:hypothetical protein
VNLLAKQAARYDPEKTRKRIVQGEGYRPEQVVRYFVRPFDFQYCYYTSVRPLWNEPRPGLWKWHGVSGNRHLVSRQVRGGEPEGSPFYFLGNIGDDHALRTDAYFFPMQFVEDHGSLYGKEIVTNLSERSLRYLKSLGYTDIDSKADIYSSMWLHALAVGFSSQYLAEHGEGIAIGWPRIPVPAQRNVFERSVLLGREIASLLDMDGPVEGVTTGKIGEHQKVLGVLTAKDLSVRAGWGHKDSKGRVNPGKGLVKSRGYTVSEREAIQKGSSDIKIDESRVFELLGMPLDIYLNETTCWRCVPSAVWDYYIGGYAVVKKWLSYREENLFGRALKKEEAREVTGMVRRLAAIVLMSDALNSSYAACRDDCIAWTEASDSVQ